MPRDGLRWLAGTLADHLLPFRRRALLAEQRLAGRDARIAEVENVRAKEEDLRAAYDTRIAALETHIASLTAAAVARELKLQEKAELDFQLLMIHQQLIAEFSNAEQQFHELYQRCRPYTMTSIERLYGLYKCIEYVVTAEIPGDLAEFGVWRGGSCMLIAETLRQLGSIDRRILMFDTFAGHPRPDAERDVDIWENRAIDDWRRETKEGTVTWGAASLQEVRANLASTGYPSENLVFVEGLVEETAASHRPERLALLRLDTDWYESTRVALEEFFPRLEVGGVLIVDDYGHYKGQQQAVDEYFARQEKPLLFHRIDYSCRAAVKR
jgi:hypothetical protein